MNTLKKLLFLLSKEERKRAVILIIIIIITSLLDVLGVASVLPFITVIINPNIVETNIFLKNMFEISNNFGVKNNQEFLFALGFIIFVLLILTLTLRALVAYLQAKFINMRIHTIGKNLVEGYLSQPYSWFISQHSADFGKNILSEVDQVVVNGLKPMLELFSKTITIITIVVLLLIVDPKMTLTVFSLLGGCYGLIYFLLRKFIAEVGQKRLLSNFLRFKVINDLFGAIKEVKGRGLEQVYINYFSKPAKVFSKNLTYMQALSQLPRFVLEAFVFGGILLVLLLDISRTDKFIDNIPLLSIYILAGYRLLPAIQQIYASSSKLIYIFPSLKKIVFDLKKNNIKNIHVYGKQNYFSLNEGITLKNIEYSYPQASDATLNNINLKILAKSFVGFVGATGSGKTTTVDIIMGLLEPQKGTLECDGKVIDRSNLKSWQGIIGYVPQNIFLIDDTVASNIAFGVESKNIDQGLVEKAAKIAKIHDFVISELKDKYQTVIGERGIKLSGGQRQRIGIARAVYFSPKLLILDESTSALDNETALEVLNQIKNLIKNTTIILISHRQDQLKYCDKIFQFYKGQLKILDNIIK